MKQWLCLLLIAGLILLTGCQPGQGEESAPSQPEPPSSKSEEEEMRDLLSSMQESRKLFEESLPLLPIPEEAYDPNKIIWYVDSADNFPGETRQTFVPALNEITEKINERLQQLGVTQQVEFRFIHGGVCDQQGKVIMGNESPAYRVNEYADEINRLLEHGAQVDLFFYQGQSKEVLADLTPYFQTNAGQKLKKCFDEKIWNALTDFGKNCFVPVSKNILGKQVSYWVKQDLMEKYEIGEEDLRKPLAELESVFQKVKDGEEKNGGAFYPLYINEQWIGTCPLEEDYKILASGVLAMNKWENRAKAQNLYENTEFIAYLKTLKNFQSQDLASPPSVDPDRCFFRMETDGSLEGTTKAGGYARIPMSGAMVGDDFRSSSICIPQSSQNKEKAFEVLTLAMTDPELSNLLTYGLEGVNYSLKDGVVVPGENYRKAYFLGNDAVAHPTADQPKDKLSAFLEYEASLKPYEAMNFQPDFTSVQTEYAAVKKVVSEYAPNLWTGQVNDVETALRELNQKMKDAGLQKLLDEINRQLDDFYAYLDNAS